MKLLDVTNRAGVQSVWLISIMMVREDFVVGEGVATLLQFAGSGEGAGARE